MNIEKEIQAIKARLDNIEAYLSGNQSQGNPHPTGDEANYELLNFEVKKAESIIGPEYAYKLTVKNNANVSTRFDGRIIFLDHSEFEVESQIIGFFTVPAHSTFTKTGKATIIDKNHAPRIADVTAEIFPS
jgi:hypothetical protein